MGEVCAVGVRILTVDTETFLRASPIDSQEYHFRARRLECGQVSRDPPHCHRK